MILYCLDEKQKIKNICITFCEVGYIEILNYASMYNLIGFFLQLISREK